ncbi:hypothetical protein [Pyrobaculum aerophilum]|uniref:Uncharacterized protein n=1 Tax=Pyrobaculum aerophilum TaxID=13773 RepID=A0A371R1D4_9CREN|nr:hypothetical protein [Pyrobaculum aerophilum]RFA97293.1 hypothetical protein CGL51_03575 [Pyrobaculum aerophilum]RFB00146.1 hypothetical protein CGL52_02065 [Pyrobaculum aerophilum]
MTRYELVGTAAVAGVRVWLWRRGQYLYLEVKYGPKREKVYLGKAAEINTEGEGPCGDCLELLRELAEAYNEAVELAKRALREGQTKEDYREALREISYAPKALREALEMVGHAEE